MPKSMSVTEARDNFPALVRQVADRDEPVVVTNRNEPQVVILRWETYRHRHDLQMEGARHRLAELVDQLEQLAAGLREGYEPDSLDLHQGTQDLWTLLRQTWVVCRLLDKPRRHLASALSDSLQILMEAEGRLSLSQLEQLLAILPLLRREDLTNDDVATADLALAEVGLDTIFPLSDDLASLYDHDSEETA